MSRIGFGVSRSHACRTTGLYSSARVKDMLGLTESLKSEEHLKPFNLKLVNE